MRVLHVTYQHSADDVRILHKQCRTLADAGYDVHLLAPPPEPPHLFNVRLHTLSAANGRNKLKLLRKWFQEIERFIREIDPQIMHLHDPLLLSLGRRMRTRSRAKLIYDVHEDHVRQIRALSHLTLPRRYVQAAVYGWLEQTAQRSIDLFIAATPSIARLHPRHATVTVRNMPRLEQYPPSSDARRSTNVIYLGGLTRSRGVMTIVDAAAQLRDDARLILAGTFDTEKTRRAAELRPGWSRVESRGWVSHGCVPALLAEAAVGIVTLQPKPNYLASWPVKLFEYMAAGLPFVASDFPGWRAMLGDRECGMFVDPANPTAIADAVNTLLDDPAFAERLGRSGRTLVEEQFNWDRESRQLLSAYERLAGA